MKNISYLLVSIFFAICVSGCKNETPNQTANPDEEKFFHGFFNEGHRGTRGLMPENTIPSMIKAIELGSNVIELDVHISKDKKVVVAHDPYINRTYSLMPNGEEIAEEDAKKHILYNMEYSEIRKFDVGSKFHPGYPEQRKMKTYIPLLGELIDSVEQYTSTQKHPPVIYNIEVKADVEQDGVYQPAPAEYIDLVLEVVKSKNLGYNRYYLQSFDIRQIQQVKEKDPNVVLGFLTGNKDKSLEENIENIGFVPQIYSPNFNLATPELVKKSHQRKMKFIPWTVNEKEDMLRLIEMEVDGIITDYPDRLSEVMQNTIHLKNKKEITLNY